jgi:hypothetical protein
MHVLPEVVFAFVLGATTGAGATLWVWIHAYLEELQVHLDSFPEEYRRQRMAALEAVVGLGCLGRSMETWSTEQVVAQWKSRAVVFTDISVERSAFRRTSVQLRAALRTWREWTETSEYVVE